MTDTSLGERTDIRYEDGSHDRFAHIVFPKSKIVESAVMGTPITALCGKTWVPNADPSRFQICPTCKEIVESMGMKVPSY